MISMTIDELFLAGLDAKRCNFPSAMIGSGGASMPAAVICATI
jgi:hypothetical protein